MKSVRLHGMDILQTPDELIRMPGTREKCIHIRLAGVCGPDLNWFSEGEIRTANLEHPHITGHGLVGETEEGQYRRWTLHSLRVE